MQKLFVAAAILALAGGLAASPARASVIASSTFGSSLDGWILNGDGTLQWASSGGNPDGYAQYSLSGQASGLSAIVAPSAFVGDYTAENASSISFDHDLVHVAGGGLFESATLTLRGAGGTATWVSNSYDFSSSVWLTYTVPLTLSKADGWSVSGASAAQILASVSKLTIQIQLFDSASSKSTDTEGIDNVVLNAVPEPAALLVLATGLLGTALVRRRGV